MDNNSASDRQVTPRDDEQKTLERLSRKGLPKDKCKPRSGRHVALELTVALVVIGWISLNVAGQRDHGLVNRIASIVTVLAFGGALGTLCIWTLFKVIQKIGPKLPLVWRWLIFRRDRLSAAHKIILASSVPAVLICLPFMVDLAPPSHYDNMASDHAGVWFVVILAIASFEWFLWGRAKDNLKKPPESDTR